MALRCQPGGGDALGHGGGGLERVYLTTLTLSLQTHGEVSHGWIVSFEVSGALVSATLPLLPPQPHCAPLSCRGPGRG